MTSTSKTREKVRGGKEGGKQKGLGYRRKTDDEKGKGTGGDEKKSRRYLRSYNSKAAEKDG